MNFEHLTNRTDLDLADYYTRFGTFANYQYRVDTYMTVTPSRLMRVTDLARRIFLDLLTFGLLGHSHHYKAIDLIKHCSREDLVEQINTWANFLKEILYCIFPPTIAIEAEELANNNTFNFRTHFRESSILKELEELNGRNPLGLDLFKRYVDLMITGTQGKTQDAAILSFAQTAPNILHQQFSLNEIELRLLNQIKFWLTNNAKIKKQQDFLLSSLMDIPEIDRSQRTIFLIETLYDAVSSWRALPPSDEEVAIGLDLQMNGLRQF